MSDESATTPDALGQWFSEWADQYDQEIDTSKLSDFVGAKVAGSGVDADGSPRGFEATIIGYGRDVLTFVLEDGEERRVYRPTLITDQGLQLPIFSGMTLSMVESE